MKLFITKYALTSGIEEVEGNISDQYTNMCTYQKEGCYPQYAHGDDWHTDKKKAIDRASVMREKKIASLRNQIKKLEGLKF